MAKLIVGCGYLGRRVAKRWLANGQTVFGLVPRPKQARQLELEGVRPIVADVTRPETLASLPPAETVLYSLGYNAHGGSSREAVSIEGLRSVLDALPPGVGRFIYTSSTGVYGQTDGSWVDEHSPCRPTREAGRVLLAAEQLLARHPLGRRTIVLRLAGLYGPDRILPKAQRLAASPSPVATSGYVNLIHVDDAADIVLAAEVRGEPPRTYVVSDGHPIDRREYYVRLARLAKVSPPEFLERSAREASLVRAGTSRRVDNTRMLAELGVTLNYPSFG